MNDTLKDSRKVVRPFKVNNISGINSGVNTPSHGANHITSETRDDENMTPYTNNP